MQSLSAHPHDQSLSLRVLLGGVQPLSTKRDSGGKINADRTPSSKGVENGRWGGGERPASNRFPVRPFLAVGDWTLYPPKWG